MNKKLVKLSLVLCASVLMAVSCNKKETTNPELPSMGTLTTPPSGSILPLPKDSQTGKEVSGAITVSGFSDSFKSAAKDKTDIKYTVKKVEVKGVKETEVEKVQKAIKEGTFDIKVESKIEEIKVGFAGSEAAKNAQDIATAIGQGKTATITLTVEASPAGATAGKYSATTFEVRLGIQVAS